MSPASVHDDGEVNQITFFIDTSLDTRLAAIVSDSDTVSHLKQKIILEHRQCYPDIGDIRIDCLKVKRRGNFYRLSDSMPIKSAFLVDKRKFWYVSVDVSRLEQVGGTQHMDRVTVGDQLALPWVTGSRLINEHDSHADKPLNLYDVNEQINSKKRTREMHNESLPEDASGSQPFVKKKRKTQKLEGDFNVSQDENFDTDKVKYTEASISNQNLFEHKSKSKDLRDENATINKDENFNARDQASVVAMVMDNDILQETPVVTSQMEKKDELVNKVTVMENEIPSSSPMMTDLKGSENKEAENEVSSTSNRMIKHKKDKGDGKKKKKSKKTVTEDKDESLVNNTDNIVCDMTSAAVHVPVPVFDEKINDQRNNDNVTAEKNEVSEKTVVGDLHVNKDHNINNNDVIDSSVKDVGPTVPESVGGEQIDKHKKSKKRKSKRSAEKNKDESLVKHDVQIVGPTSSLIPPAPVFNNDKIIDDGVGLLNAETIDVLENVCKDGSLVVGANESDVAVKVVEVSKPIESAVEKSVKKVKDAKRSSKKKKNESLLVKHDDNFVGDVSSAPVFDVKNDDKVGMSNAEMKQVSEKKFEDDSHVKTVKKSDVNVNIVENLKPTETVEESLPKVVKDIGRSKKKKKDFVKPKDVATVTNEENVLPPSEKKENVEMTSSVNNLNGELGKTDDINADVRISGDEKKENQVNAEGVNDDNLEKLNEKMNDGTKKSRKKKTAKKSGGKTENESSKLHHSSELKKIEPENIKSVELDHLPEEAIKNVNVSQVVSKVVQMEENHDDVINNEVDIPKDESNEIDFKNYFVSNEQPNKSKKKTKELVRVETSVAVDNKQQNREQDVIATTQSQKSCLINENRRNISADVAKESKVQNTDVMKTPTRTKKIDTSKGLLVSGQTQVKTVKKIPVVINSSQNVKKSLLNTPGNIFGDDTDESGADDNLTVNSDSSTRTPSKNASSSSEESVSSIDSRRNGSRAVKRKEIGGKNNISSQSRPKNTSMVDLLRSSTRFKKAKLTASKQVEDTESQPVDFVPESQPI